MKRTNVWLIGACILLLCMSATDLTAKMYKWRDSNGVLHFSDELPAERQAAGVKIESSQLSGSGEGVIENGFGMSFKRIQPGKFIMGKYYVECCDNVVQEDAREVTLTKEFYIQTTEVTQRQWASVMNTRPSRYKSCGGDCPVEMVTWSDAMNFIETLNQMDPARQYRLPTEAEWEYAARAGSDTKFGFGDDKKMLRDYGWYWDNSGDRTHPVAQKKPNRWGLYDMHGNVWEYCQDGYSVYRSKKPVTDPVKPSKQSKPVLRGGSFRHCPNASWSASRCYGGKAADTTGFRLVVKTIE